MTFCFVSWTYIVFHGDRIGGVLVIMLASHATGSRVKPKLWNWYLLLLREARNIKKKEQRQFGFESGEFPKWSDMSTRGL